MPTATNTTFTLSWTTEHRIRMEAARVVLSDRGMRVNGYIVSRAKGSFGASYSVLTDADGRSRRLTARSDDGSGEHELLLMRTPDGQWLVESPAESTPQRKLGDAQDVAIAGSPMTATLAVRRLGLHRAAGEGSLAVVRVTVPSLGFEAVTYHYRTVSTHENGSRIAVDGGPEGAFEVDIDREGFVTSTPADGWHAS